MKSVWRNLPILVCLFILSQSANIHESEEDDKLEDFFRKIIEMVRPEMKRGSSEVGIEVMDPLKVPDYRYEQPGELVSIRAYFNHINIPGLSNFKLDDVIVNRTRQQVALKFSYPSISAIGDYVFETLTLGLPVGSATGRFQMLATDIRAVGIVKLMQDPRSGVFQCKSVELKSTERKVELSMENLAGDNLLRNVLDPREVYNEYKPRINGRIADAVKKMLNFMLRHYAE